MINLLIFLGLIAYLFVATVRRSAAAIAAVLCMFTLEQWGQFAHQFFVQHRTLANYLTGSIVMLGVILGILRGKRLFSHYPPLGISVIGFYFFAFISTLWAPSPEDSFSYWVRHAPFIVTYVILCPLLFTNTNDLREAYKHLIVVGSILVVLLLFVAKWDGRSIVLGSAEGELIGNPLAVAQMAGYLALPAVLLRGPRKLFWIAGKALILSLCVALIIKSGSRGQLLAVIVVCVAMWPLSYQIKNPMQFTIAIILLAAFGIVIEWTLEFFWGGGERWSQDQMGKDVQGRLDMGIALLSAWRHGTILTLFCGLGNSAAYKIVGSYPHNMFIEVLGEEGIIGLVWLLFILIYVLRSAVSMHTLLRNNKEDEGVYSVLLGMFLVAFILSMKQGSMIGNSEFFMFAIMIGKYRRLTASKILQGLRKNASTIKTRTKQTIISAHMTRPMPRTR
jgi:hypothetical protein